MAIYFSTLMRTIKSHKMDFVPINAGDLAFMKMRHLICVNQFVVFLNRATH